LIKTELKRHAFQSVGKNSKPKENEPLQGLTIANKPSYVIFSSGIFLILNDAYFLSHLI
jgi:hypothetical protein